MVRGMLAAAASLAVATVACADILPGLEAYGDLTLVDSIDCATDTTHRFREYPANRSYVTNILGSACRVMHHMTQSETPNGGKSGCYVSWRLGEGRGIVPNDPYVLIVEYPDEAPRSVTLMNFGNGVRHGWHTGFTVGDSMAPPYVTQSLESWAIPYSGEYKKVVEVMVPFERATQYNGGERIDVATAGFDVNFALIPWDEAKDSVGLALRSVKLYKIGDYEAAKPEIHYPAGDVPRRIVTSRDEMGDNDWKNSFDNPRDFWRGRAKLIRLLGMNTCSKDLLEFGYQQNWEPGSWWWNYGWAEDYWTKIVDYLAAEDIYILPFYEYAGGRGSGGDTSYGRDTNYKPKVLSADSSGQSNPYNFSNQSYVYDCLADVTLSETRTDLNRILDFTILKYKDKANFLGAWIRNRGHLPLGFGDKTIALFNEETGRTAAGTSVTRSQIYNNGSYSGTALYNEYRAWWYGKRRDLFVAARDYLVQGGVANARVFYSNTIEEPGEFWKNWGNPLTALEKTEEGYTFQGQTFTQFSGKSARTNVGWTASEYGPNALFADSPTWGSYEINHSAPADDPYNYTNLNHIALCYPFNCVWTIVGGFASQYRNASGDLPFVRHYSLNENDLKDHTGGDDYKKGQEICGYYTCDWDHAGRAVMLSELYAMSMSDPTMLAYLFGSNLDRTDSIYVREFNLNFLSLPATKSSVLSGGYWGADQTVRHWTTAAGNYWAVINLSTEPYEGDFNLQTSKGRVYRTVDWTAESVSSGSVHLSMEPLQMIALTDIAPDGPVVGVVCTGVDGLAATLTVTVSALPGGTGTATLECATSADFSGAVVADTRTVTAIGSYQVSLAGLEPNTSYYVRATLACGQDSTQATTGFTSGIPPTFPCGTMEAIASVNAATFNVALSTIGEGADACDLYAVCVPAASGLASITKKIGTCAAAGSYSFEVGPLSSEATYAVTLYATNNLGYRMVIGAAAVTTLAKPAVTLGAGALAEGLIQAKVWTNAKSSMNKTFDILATEGATRVPGAAMAGVTASASTYTSQYYENPYDGQKFYYSQYDTTFGYTGEMYFEAGRTYTIGKSYDDGVLVKIDGTDILDHQAYNGTTTKTYTPTSTGWKPIEIRLWDGDGGKGPKNGWTNFVGVAWNTNNFTTISDATKSSWTPFMVDAGAPLRCRSDVPALASVGSMVRNGDSLIVSVVVDSYDEDNALSVYVTRDATKAAAFSVPDGTSPDLSGWMRADGATPAVGLGQTINVAVSGLSLVSGETVYAVARLVNARTGYDVVSTVSSYTIPDGGAAAELIALGEPVGACSSVGTNATASVEVSLAYVLATLVLKVDGAVVRTWDGVTPGTTYSASFPITVGETKNYVFTLSAEGCADVEKTGAITGRRIVDWFSVPLTNAAYAAWTLATGADPHDGAASWSLSGGRNASAVGSDGSGSRVLALATGSDGAVVYEPANPSEAGRPVEIGGTATLHAHVGVPPEPAGSPLAGLAVGTVNGAAVLHGYGATGWVALSGGNVVTNAPVAWTATLDFDAGTTAYALNGVAFAPKTALRAGATQAASVVFRGNGAIGAFRGIYAEPDGAGVSLYDATIREDGTGLAFTSLGSSSDTFNIRLQDTVAGRYYVAFAADTLDTPRAEWICVACEQADAAGAAVDLPCDTVDALGHPIPSQFFMIFGASQPIVLGTTLGAVAPSND